MKPLHYPLLRALFKASKRTLRTSPAPLCCGIASDPEKQGINGSAARFHLWQAPSPPEPPFSSSVKPLAPRRFGGSVERRNLILLGWKQRLREARDGSWSPKGKGGPGPGFPSPSGCCRCPFGASTTQPQLRAWSMRVGQAGATAGSDGTKGAADGMMASG